MSFPVAAAGPSAYWYLTRGTGAVTLILLSASVVLGIVDQSRWRSERWPRFALDALHQTVSIKSGGLATSSTTVRRWRSGGRELHHIFDPATGRPAAPIWRTVSVAAASCVAANTATTAAIVLGARAAEWLAARELPARLVHVSGRVTLVGDWPAEAYA